MVPQLHPLHLRLKEGHCHVAALMGLVTQNLILGLGDAGGAHFTLRVVALVNALVHIGTGVVQVVEPEPI